ncbi:MAG: 2'-5' RNA ligase family protein, partial [Acidimicrobiales bacterium]
MRRLRLAVALLVPAPVAAEVDGLRRALRSGALGRIPPHVTLVPPVNVREQDLGAVLERLRGAARGARPFRLTLGPMATFWPRNPVLYLAVGGPGVEALGRLRDALVAEPPLRRGPRAGPPAQAVAPAPPDRPG